VRESKYNFWGRVNILDGYFGNTVPKMMATKVVGATLPWPLNFIWLGLICVGP
jgi:hypothetical protein